MIQCLNEQQDVWLTWRSRRHQPIHPKENIDAVRYVVSTVTCSKFLVQCLFSGLWQCNYSAILYELRLDPTMVSCNIGFFWRVLSFFLLYLWQYAHTQTCACQSVTHLSHLLFSKLFERLQHINRFWIAISILLLAIKTAFLTDVSSCHSILGCCRPLQLKFRNSYLPLLFRWLFRFLIAKRSGPALFSILTNLFHVRWWWGYARISLFLLT